MNCELVYLVNGGREQHKQFRETFLIRPQILIDEEGTVGQAYDVYQPNSDEGVGHPVYKASTVYLIDQYGKIACYWISSGPRGRPDPECILGILALAKDNDWTY